jgi:hypothetical protein
LDDALRFLALHGLENATLEGASIDELRWSSKQS